MQNKKQSFVESLINVLIGFVVSLLSQLIIFPIVGVNVELKTNIEIMLYFTAISIIRSYIIRRLFNK